jgi:hypothetical protein
MLARHNLIMTSYVNLPPLSDEHITTLLAWHDSTKETLSNPGAVALKQPWIASKIRDFAENLESPTTVVSSIPGNPWNFDFISRFPEIAKIFNSLPFDKIERIYLLQNNKFCESHNDQSSFLYDEFSIEPCNYRMTLRGSKVSKGFFVQPKPFKSWGSADALKNQGLPVFYWNAKPGYWWTLNNFCCQHGSDWKRGDDKVIISIQGTPNTEKHLELLKNSEHLKCIEHPNLVKFDSLSAGEKQKKIANFENFDFQKEIPETLKNKID